MPLTATSAQKLDVKRAGLPMKGIEGFGLGLWGSAGPWFHCRASFVHIHMDSASATFGGVIAPHPLP